jgi:hypothetical protein
MHSFQHRSLEFAEADVIALRKCVGTGRHHVTKARDDDAKAGRVFLLDKLIGELASRFDPNRNGFPAHLDLEQQGLFVLGYRYSARRESARTRSDIQPQLIYCVRGLT